MSRSVLEKIWALTDLWPNKAYKTNGLVTVLPDGTNIGIVGVRISCTQEWEFQMMVACRIDHDVWLDFQGLNMLRLLPIVLLEMDDAFVVNVFRKWSKVDGATFRVDSGQVNDAFSNSIVSAVFDVAPVEVRLGFGGLYKDD